MMFEATITLGTLLQIAAYLGSAAYFIWRLQLRLEIIDAKQQNTMQEVHNIKKDLEKLTLVIVEQARQSARLDNFESRMQELSNRIHDTRQLTSQ